MQGHPLSWPQADNPAFLARWPERWRPFWRSVAECNRAFWRWHDCADPAERDRLALSLDAADAMMRDAVRDVPEAIPFVNATVAASLGLPPVPPIDPLPSRGEA